MIRIFRVTMTTGDCWCGASPTFESAAETACIAFNAPLRAVKSVEVTKIIDY